MYASLVTFFKYILALFQKKHPTKVQILVSQKGTIMVTATVGQKLPLTLQWLDQSGKPMPAPTLDAKGAWSNTTPANETLAPSTDGTSCVGTEIAVGTDSIGYSAVIGGKTFTAQPVAVTINPAPQILTSVVIVPGAPF